VPTNKKGVKKRQWQLKREKAEEEEKHVGGKQWKKGEESRHVEGEHG
jgi:hypothetical protein